MSYITKIVSIIIALYYLFDISLSFYTLTLIYFLDNLITIGGSMHKVGRCHFWCYWPDLKSATRELSILYPFGFFSSQMSRFLWYRPKSHKKRDTLMNRVKYQGSNCLAPTVNRKSTEMDMHHAIADFLVSRFL